MRPNNGVLKVASSSNPFYKYPHPSSCPNGFYDSSNKKNHTRKSFSENQSAAQSVLDSVYSRIYYNTTYATGQVILDRDVRAVLTDGQHFAWRYTEWNKIISNIPPSKYKSRATLECFMDIDPMSHNHYKNALIHHYLYSQNEIPLGNERILAIDSSFLVQHYTSHFMHFMMKNNLDADGDILMEVPTTIFVETYLPIIESLFKVNNATRSDYQNIEFNKVNDYIQYSKLPPHHEVGMKIRCSQYEVHQRMKEREDLFFDQRGEYASYGGKWESGIRNMINDHVIIDALLDTSKKIPTSVPIIATNDRGMLRYAHQKGVRFITTLDDGIFSSNYDLNGFQQRSIHDYITV